MADTDGGPVNNPSPASAPKAKGYKFHGGADSIQLEEGGKSYLPGEVVPISEAQAIALRESAGIIFEELGQRYSEATAAEWPVNR